MPASTDQYGTLVGQLLSIDADFPLGPGRPITSAAELLESLDHQSLLGGAEPADAQMADACLGGLWLRFNYLDRSHTISQSIHTSSGSYWHGVMHRREPDYSNAKYWFRRVGEHPVFPLLAAEADDFAVDGCWDPFGFVDACEVAVGRGGEQERRCREVSECEWRLLFDYCYRAARGD